MTVSKTFALTTRSLRVDSRLLRSHLLRFVLLAVLFWLLFQAQVESLAFGAPGLNLFTAVSWLNVVFLTLAGVSFFSTAITEEKEEQTLGLLRMAGINPIALLLGKSAPRLVTALLLLATQFPFTLLAITLGGVTTHQVASTYWTLFAYLALLVNLGLFWSVVCDTSRAASVMTAISLAAFFAVPSLVAAVLTGYASRGQISGSDPLYLGVQELLSYAYEATVFARLNAIMTTGFSDPPVGFQVISNFVAAVVLLAMSWVWFRLFVREEPTATPGRGLLSLRRRRWNILSAGRAWRSAIVWKEFNFLAGGKALMAIKFIAYGAVFPLLDLYSRAVTSYSYGRWKAEDYGGALMGGMLFAAAVELVLYSSRMFREEIRWRTFSSLAMLPGSITKLSYSKMAGCVIALAPAFFYFCVGMFLDSKDVANFLEHDLDEPVLWWFLLQYVLGLHLVVFYTLFVKWGAIPLAATTLFLANGFCMGVWQMSFGGMGGDGNIMFALLILLALVATLVVHALIGERLRTLAAE